MDSLLGEDMEFDVVTRPAPEITAEVTTTLEELIKKRIRDGDFDDVEPRQELPAANFRPAAELDQEKSKLALGDVYEKDYLQAMNKTPTEATAKLTKEHEEIRALMVALDHQLNALSNFNYVRPVFIHPLPCLPVFLVES